MQYSINFLVDGVQHTKPETLTTASSLGQFQREQGLDSTFMSHTSGINLSTFRGHASTQFFRPSSVLLDSSSTYPLVSIYPLEHSAALLRG